MLNYKLITQDEMLRDYTDWEIRCVELNTTFGRRMINIISDGHFDLKQLVVKVMNNLEEIYGLEELLKHDTLINCVVSE